VGGGGAVIGWLRIVRPVNLLILAAAILLGRALAGGGGEGVTTVFAVVAALLLAAGFYVWNDVTDREVDRVNRPARPIPSGSVSARAAGLAAIILLTGALAAALAAGPAVLVAIVVWSLLLVLYEKYLKHKGFTGNLLVSVIASSSLLYGAWLGGSAVDGIAPALFAFFLHLGREIVKDIHDEAGDRAGDRRTLAIAHGERRALLISVFPLALLALLAPVPYLIGMYNLVYLIAVLVGIDLCLLLVVVHCFTRPGRESFRLLSVVLKSQMVLGMTAIFFGSTS